MRKAATRILLWAVCGVLILSMHATAQESSTVPKDKRASAAEVRRLLKATNAIAVGKQVVDQFVDMMAKHRRKSPTASGKK